MEKVAVLIPSYNRPDSLDKTLGKLSPFDVVKEIFVVADASSDEIMQEYSEVLAKYPRKVIGELTVGHRGSAKTRNAVRKLALQHFDGVKYVLFFDDDFQLPNESTIEHMILILKSRERAGVVGGRIVNIKSRAVDPEFSFPVSQEFVNILGRFTGFLFNGRTKGLIIGKATTCFMLLKSELLNHVSYDENYLGSGYREESDFQEQIAHLGYEVLSDNVAFVYHYAPDDGGCRESQCFSSRMHWKSRNHTYFILKWNNSRGSRIWYMLMSQLLLISYRPFSFLEILKGLKSGYKSFYDLNPKLHLPKSVSN